jgi:uncharacterized coiled-coil DUF342 family protein
MSKPITPFKVSFKDLQDKIEGFKQKRDDLNKKTKDYINTLQDIEGQIIDALKSARDVYKKKRDYWNRKVKQLKDKKIEYKNLLDTLTDDWTKIQKLRNNNKGARVYTSIKQIERKIDNLERQIEIENLEMIEENAIIDTIRELAAKKQEFLSEQQSDELYRIERKIEIVKINLNKIYEQLSKWSNKSQDNHKKMLEIFENVNELRENKKKMEEELIDNKKTADQYHEQYLELMTEKKKRNKNNNKRNSQRSRQRQPRQKYTTKHPNKNEQLIEKMKADKLATALEKQKAGKKLNLYEARLILEQGKY